MIIFARSLFSYIVVICCWFFVSNLLQSQETFADPASLSQFSKDQATPEQSAASEDASSEATSEVLPNTAESGPPENAVADEQPQANLDEVKEPSREPNLFVKALLSKKGPVVKNGLVWRVFTTRRVNNQQDSFAMQENKNIAKLSPNLRNNRELIELQKSDKAEASFALEPGIYYVQCSFGRVSAIKLVSINLDKSTNLTINLDCGALSLYAKVEHGNLLQDKLKFAIYTDESENNDYSLILPQVKLGQIIPLKSGFYHLVSYYGAVNAVKRANLKIEAGKISEVTFNHAASQVNLRLVRNSQGEAIADTKWWIKDASGDEIFNSVGAYVSVILMKGRYTAFAQNKGNVYQKDFVVNSGEDLKLDVLTSDKAHFKDNKADDWATD